MNYFGLLIGIATVFIFGLGFALVIHGERILGLYWWPYMMTVGILLIFGSLFIEVDWFSACIGVLGATFIWGSTELKEQAVRAELGWYPLNVNKIKPPFEKIIKKMESASSMIGLLVMAYGGPKSLDEVEPYLLDVRGYRPTAPEIIHEVRERYREIGGRSPILAQTKEQAAALEAALNTNKQEFKAFVGMRHWHPYIKDTLAEMQAQGIEHAVGLVMAPHYSRMSIEAYFKKVGEAESAIEVAPIKDWHLLPGYLDALVSRVCAALERFPAEVRAQVPVIFSAHSLPERILEWNDPYPDQLQETVEALMQRLGDQPHDFAFQSAAISTEPWLGPDVSELIKRYAGQGQKNIISCPIGFVCEHVEVLYDIDIVYQKLAGSLGVRLERIEMVHTAPQMISDLAELIRNTAKESHWL